MYSLSINNNIHISFKKIVCYLIIFAIPLFLSAFIKDGIGALSFMIFVFLYLKKDKEKLILFIIGWIYISDFFIGQGFISYIQVYHRFFDGNLYILILFITFYRKKWIKPKFNKKLFSWAIIFLIIIFFSDLYHNNLQINIVNQVWALLLFFLVLYIPNKESFNSKMINLIISIAILQVIISALQFFQIIPPSLRHNDLEGLISLTPKLDDVASGTFGAFESNRLSGFLSFLFFIFFSFGFYKRNLRIMMISFIFLIQFAFVDSKTILGITILTFIYLLFKLKIFNAKNIGYIFLIALVFVIGSYSIKSYYNRAFVGGYTNVSSKVSYTADVLLANIQDWGKIAGFKYISEDWLKKNPSFFIFGYGRGNYNKSNNMALIEDMDTPLMQLNNVTNSRSFFISQYATLGIPGLLISIWLFIIFFKELKKRNFFTIFGKSFQLSGLSILFSAIIIMFIYGGFSIMSKSFLVIFIFYALVLRIENDYAKNTTNPKPE